MKNVRMGFRERVNLMVNSKWKCLLSGQEQIVCCKVDNAVGCWKIHRIGNAGKADHVLMLLLDGQVFGRGQNLDRIFFLQQFPKMVLEVGINSIFTEHFLLSPEQLFEALYKCYTIPKLRPLYCSICREPGGKICHVNGLKKSLDSYWFRNVFCKVGGSTRNICDIQKACFPVLSSPVCGSKSVRYRQTMLGRFITKKPPNLSKNIEKA